VDVVVPAKESVRLIKIGGLGDIGGNRDVISAGCAGAVYLNSEQHRDAILFQCARQIDCFRPAPAMSVNNNSGILLLFGS